MYNGIDEAKNDTQLQGLAVLEKKMIAGETGLGEYKYQGADKFVGYAPVSGTTWSVGIAISKNEILLELNSLQISVMMDYELISK